MPQSNDDPNNNNNTNRKHQQYPNNLTLNVHPSSANSSSGHHMDRIVSPSSPRVNTNISTSSSASNLQQAFSNNNNNNINISFENVQEEIITVPLSQELIQVYQKQLSECIQKLKQTHTDGKDKAKSLEQIIYLACTLKSDFTMALFGEFNKTSSNNQQTNSSSNNNTNTTTTTTTTSSSTLNAANNNNSTTTTASPTTTTGQWTYTSQLDLFIKCMRYLLLHRSSYIRSLTVRCMRYIIQNDPCNFPFELLWTKYNCHLLIFKMMLNDTDREKIQVLELIRTLCTNFVKRKQSKLSYFAPPQHDIHIPFLFMKGIVHFLSYIDGTLLQMEQQQPQQPLNSRSTTAPTTSTTAGQGANNGNTSTAGNNTSNTNTATTNNLSSSANDQKKQYFLESYKSVCIEILRDSLIHDESLCSTIIKCGGFKYLIELLLNNKFSTYHNSILSSILYICDRYKTRKFMKKGLLQLLYLISPFTNYSQLHQPLSDAINTAKLTNPNLVPQLTNDLNQLILELERSKNIILFLMRSWTGLFIVNQDNINILGTISNLLKSPSRTQLKHLILDMYIEILKQSAPSKYHYLIPPVFSECERKSKPSNTISSPGTTGATTTVTINGGAGNTTTGGVGAGSALGSSSGGPLNTSTSSILTSSAASSVVHGGFSNDVTFYADHSGDEDRVVNICFVFLSMTILTLIDSGLIDSLLYLSKQSMINNKKKQTKNVDQKDKLNITDDDDEDKSERAFISFRASQLLQSVLLFSDMLLNKRTCLNMQDRFDTEIANFLVSISKSNLYSYKTLSMLSAFYQQSFQSSTVGGGSIHVDQAMIQAPNSLSVLSDSTSDSLGDRFSKFSTNNIPTFYIRTQIDSDMDDQSFNQLIKESNVLVTKDPKRWNWEKIYCLIFGPLRVAHRLKEVTTKSQKLLKRILSYFKPYKRAFSDLKYQESNFGYTKLCNELLYNLLHMDESGIEIIRECKIIKQFYEVLEIEVRVGKTTSVGGRNDQRSIDSDKRLLSEERVQKYMVRDYFTIIGLMSSTIKGKELLEEEKIFDILKDLTTRRDDISQLIIKHLDYTRPFSDRAREILKEAMMNGSNIIRYISTLFIRNLIRQSQTYPNNFHAWGVPLLTSKLYDDWEKVKFSAISILSEVCCMNTSSNSSSAGDSSATSDFDYDDSATSMLSSPRVSNGSNENLLAFVSQNISRDVMESVMREGRDGMNLLLKMTSCREGIDYLSHDSIRLLQELVEDWYERESYQYLQQVEYGLNRFYNMNQSAPSNSSYSPSSTIGHTAIGGSQLIVGSLSPSGFRETGMGSPTFKSSGQAQFQSLSGSYDYAKHGVILQSNLYGELCHTLEGCTILTNDKHRTLHCLCMNLLNVYQSVLTYHTNITNRSSSSNDTNIEPLIEQIVELWSLAFCCSTNTGYEYCNRYIQQVIIGYEKNHNESAQTMGNEQFTVVQYFVYIALHSKDISLRGTMLYLLGILSKCSLARKDLFEIGFECSYRYAISIPRDRKSFFTIITDNSSSSNKSKTSSTKARKEDFDEDDHLLTSILKESPTNADLIKDLVSNVTKIANPVHEQQSSTNLQNLRTNIGRVLTNNEKSKLIYYFLGNHFTHCKYKWKIIKFVINDLLGGNSSMLCSSIATSSFDTNIEDELYVMNTHLLWLDTETDFKINKLQQQ